MPWHMAFHEYKYVSKVITFGWIVTFAIHFHVISKQLWKWNDNRLSPSPMKFLPMSTVFHQLLCRESVRLLLLWWQHSLDPLDGSPAGLQFKSIIRIKNPTKSSPVINVIYQQASEFASLKMLDLLCRVWSTEPRIWPSPLINRCNPGLAEYRCLSRTTWLQLWAIWGPWSDKGMQTTPTEKIILAMDTVTTNSSMVHQIRCKFSAAASPSWPCEVS